MDLEQVSEKIEIDLDADQTLIWVRIQAETIEI